MSYFLLIPGFILLYHDTLAHMARIMSTAEGSHGFIVVGVSLYLVWRKRKDLRELPRMPAHVPGALLTAFGCFLLAAGKLGSTMLLQQISMVPTILGLILLLRGPAHFRAFLIPVGYLVFITGIAEEVLGSAGIYLQTVSAWISAQVLALAGMPVLLRGTVIELPHIALEVVRACSGISHIVNLVALSVPLALLSLNSLPKKLLLVAAAFFIGIFANGLRIALIGVYTMVFPGGPLHGPGETLYVSFIFFLGMVVLILLSHWLSKLDGVPQSPQVGVSKPWVAAPGQKASLSKLQKEIPRPRMPFRPVAMAVAIFIVAFCFIHLFVLKPIPLKNSLQGLPTQISGFIGQNLDQIDRRFRPFPADEELLRVYENGNGEKAEVYIGYFEAQTRERKVVDYRRDWMHAEAVPIPAGPFGSTVYINQTRLRDKDDTRTVFFWYSMGGKIVTGRWEGKLRALFGSLFERRTNAAVVVVSTRNSAEEIMPFITELLPAARALLAGI
jgi:EpsI family protein